jgi:hypothetical protein
MNRFADEMKSLWQRAAGDRLAKTLEGLEILNDLPDDRRKKPRVRLPYSCDPRAFEKPREKPRS